MPVARFLFQLMSFLHFLAHFCPPRSSDVPGLGSTGLSLGVGVANCCSPQAFIFLVWFPGCYAGSFLFSHLLVLRARTRLFALVLLSVHYWLRVVIVVLVVAVVVVVVVVVMVVVVVVVVWWL